MTTEEKSAIIGYYRNGMTDEQIACFWGISPQYVRMIIDSYLKENE